MGLIRASFLSVFSVSFAIGGAACRGGDEYQKGAQEQLADDFSCPIERVIATPRKDLQAYELMVGTHDKPPSDIAADPGRLAVWQKKQQTNEDNYNREYVYQVKGCDHEVYYVCSHANASNDAIVVACSKANHPPTPVK